MTSRRNDSPFAVDEELLREWILKAYHGERPPDDDGGRDRVARALAAVRQLLSGPPGGAPAAKYWFEKDPAASVRSFAEDLELSAAGLAAAVMSPIVEHCRAVAARNERQVAPNLSVYVSSLAGAVAVKAKLDETVACALISATLLGVASVGTAPFREALATLGAGGPGHEIAEEE